VEHDWIYAVIRGSSVYFAAICLQLTAVTSQREWVLSVRNIGQMISRCQNVCVVNSTCDRQCHEGCYCIIVNTSISCSANVAHCVRHYNIFQDVTYVFFPIPFYSPFLWSHHLVWWQLLQQKYCHKRVLERIKSCTVGIRMSNLNVTTDPHLPVRTKICGSGNSMPLVRSA